MENNPKLLICPDCWKEIPNVVINTTNSKVVIKIQCKCSNKIKEMDLSSYINTIKSIPASSSICNACSKSTGIKYCIDCFKWYCNSCLNTHKESSPLHTHLINVELNAHCKQHNKNYSSFCSQCEMNICVECRQNHYQHEMLRFETVDCNKLRNDVEQINDYLTKNRSNKEVLLGHIENKINEYADIIERFCNYKERITQAFEQNNTINHIYKEFIEIIYSTVTSLDKHAIHSVNNLVNSINLSFDHFELNLQSYSLDNQIEDYSTYLQSKPIFYQKQRYSCISTLTDHNKSIQSLIELNDDLMASCSWDKTIKIWEFKVPKCIATLTGHEHIVQCLAYLKDKTLASGSWDETIKIWDLKEYKCLNTIKGHLSYVWCIIQLRNGLICSGSWDKTIRLWDIAAGFGKSQGVLPANAEYILCLVELIDERLAAGSADCNITIWDLPNKTISQVLKGHDNNVWCLIQLHDGRLVSGSGDEKILYWNLDTGKASLELTEHRNSILAIHQLGKDKLLSCSSDETIKIWNLDNEHSIATFTDHKNAVRSVIRLSNGYLASCSDDKTIKLYALK